MCRGKIVTLWGDSDHPLTDNAGSVRQPLQRPGYDGTMRAAKMLSGIAAEVRWCRWSDSGFDPALPSGYDVRDWLVKGGG